MSANPAPTTVAIHDLIAGRWSPRAFTSEPVSPDHVRQVLEAARWAPSSSNLQPWRFIVWDRHLDQAAYDRAFATLVPFNQDWNRHAPMLIGVTARTLSPKGEPNRTALYDTGAAAYAIMLQAHALGLAAHQMAGFDFAGLQAEFQIPEDVSVIAMMTLGHPGRAEQLEGVLHEREVAPRSRLPVAEIAYAGAWGTAL